MKLEYIKNGDYYIPNINLSSKNKNVKLGKYGRLREKHWNFKGIILKNGVSQVRC